MTSPTSSRATSPARSTTLNPTMGGRPPSSDLSLSPIRRTLPPIITNRSQTQDNEGGDTATLETARHGDLTSSSTSNEGGDTATFETPRHGDLTSSSTSSESSPFAPETILTHLYDRSPPVSPPSPPVKPSIYLHNRIHDRADSSLVAVAGAIPSSSSSSPPPAPPTPASPTLTPAQAAESMTNLFTEAELSSHTPTRDYIEHYRHR